MSETMAAGGGLAGWLFGRRTYEDLLSYWNQQRDSPLGPMLNNAPKYVASTTLAEPLQWPNATLLRGDVADAVGALKSKADGVLGIMGSGELMPLMAADLIDEYLLIIHALVLGAGRRLSRKRGRVAALANVTTAGGTIIATYDRVAQ